MLIYTLNSVRTVEDSVGTIEDSRRYEIEGKPSSVRWALARTYTKGIMTILWCRNKVFTDKVQRREKFAVVVCQSLQIAASGSCRKEPKREQSLIPCIELIML